MAPRLLRVSACDGKRRAAERGSGCKRYFSEARIDKYTHFLVDKIAEHARPVEDSKAIAQVGSISSGNDDEVGRMIADAMEKVGKEGVISQKKGRPPN